MDSSNIQTVPAVGMAGFKFLNLAATSLPLEDNPSNTTHQVAGFFYSKVTPQQRKNPVIACLSESALALIDLEKQQLLKEDQTNQTARQFLSGNAIPSNALPVAHCYCGHQFGGWAGQLGDGRAISLGDIHNKNGDIVELQLKGSGMTPYSRFADGNAVLRSSIREFLCSEAMHYLGIPTTRAASLVVTDDTAQRDPFYDQHVVQEKCAIVLRLAQTFIRFGSFQICDKGGPSEGLGDKMIPQLLDFVVHHHYPQFSTEKDQKAMLFFQDLTQKTANLVAQWQAVGFCHGVLNTDNMSIVGVTIDYGPFGFMEHFDKNYACNHSDKDGYYSYQNQPRACQWNLMRLAESLAPCLDSEAAKQYVENNFNVFYEKQYYDLMRRKLGFLKVNKYSDKDKILIDSLMDTMHQAGSEFTQFFRTLAGIIVSKENEDGNDKLSENDLAVIKKLVSLSAPIEEIIERSKPKLNEVQLAQMKRIMGVNAALLKMRGITEEFLKEQEEQLEVFYELSGKTQEEIDFENNEMIKLWIKRYKKRLQLEIQDDNNIDLEQFNKNRQQEMNKVNPSFVLTNQAAQNVIEQAEKGDYSGIQKLLDILSQPFQDVSVDEGICKISKDKNSKKICVSCSS